MTNLTSWKYRSIGFITSNHNWYQVKPSGFQLAHFALFWHSALDNWYGIEIHWRGKIVWDWTLYEPKDDYICEFCGNNECDCEDDF
jgi:hypothetical protein